MNYEEVEPKLRVGNLLLGKVVEVVQETIPTASIAPEPSIEELIAKRKELCERKGHPLRIKLVKNRLRLACACGKEETRSWYESYSVDEHIFKYLRQQDARIAELERVLASLTALNRTK